MKFDIDVQKVLHDLTILYLNKHYKIETPEELIQEYSETFWKLSSKLDLLTDNKESD